MRHAEAKAQVKSFMGGFFTEISLFALVYIASYNYRTMFM